MTDPKKCSNCGEVLTEEELQVDDGLCDACVADSIWLDPAEDESE